jgi:hypothetical protein
LTCMTTKNARRAEQLRKLEEIIGERALDLSKMTWMVPGSVCR